MFVFVVYFTGEAEHNDMTSIMAISKTESSDYTLIEPPKCERGKVQRCYFRVWSHGGKRRKGKKVNSPPTFSGMTHMLGNHKNCFFRPGLFSIHIPEGIEEGGTSILRY